MRILRKLLRFIYAIYAILLFVIMVIPVFLWSISVSPFGRIKGGNLIYKACVIWADLWFALLFIRHKNIYEEKFKKDQSYIFVANHISYLDSALIPKVFRKPVRPLGKIEMTRIPLFGYIYKNVIVTVDRGSVSNRARSVQVLKSILRKGISVLVFPEGTFNETGKPLQDFYDGAFRIAIETGTPVKPVLFLDSYDRMHYQSVFSFNPGRSRALFLKEIPTDGYGLKEVQKLKNEVFQLMENKLKEYGASWIKEGKQSHMINKP